MRRGISEGLHDTSRPFATPALAAWRDELRAGKRTRTTFDALFRAAVAEQWALDYAQVPSLAAKFREDAKRIVFDALRKEPAA